MAVELVAADGAALDKVEHEYPIGCAPRMVVTRELYFSNIPADPNDPDNEEKGAYDFGHEDQQRFHEAAIRNRFQMSSGAGQGGKTRMAAAEVGPIALTPGTRGVIVAPTFELGQACFEFLRDDLLHFIKALGLPLSFDTRHGGQMTFQPNQGRMMARLVDRSNPDARPSVWSVKSAAPGHEGKIKSFGYDWAILEEASEAHSKEAWELLRIRMKTQRGKAILLYNPKGPNNWVSQLNTKVRAGKLPGWWHDRLEARNNPGLMEKEVDPNELSESTRRRMEMGIEASDAGLVFQRFDRKRHMIRLPPEADPRRTHQRWGSIDFGFRDPFVALFATVAGKGRDARIYVHRCYLKRMRLVRDHGRRLQRYLKEDGGLGKFQGFFADWDAQARRELKRHWDILTKRATKDILEGIDWVNQLLDEGRLLFSKEFPVIADDLESYEWSLDGQREIPKGGQADHIPDALRYLCMGLRKRKIVM